MNRPRVPIHDERVVELLQLLFVPYSYGAGKPSEALSPAWPDGVRGNIGGAGHGGLGLDCSGSFQWCLVRSGLLAPNTGDRGSAELYRDSIKVGQGAARFGDGAYYGPAGKVQHVMFYLGDGVVLGASGGTSATNGDDPRAFVMLRPTGYRADFIGFGRLRA